jgi:hypothetical protein
MHPSHVDGDASPKLSLNHEDVFWGNGGNRFSVKSHKVGFLFRHAPMVGDQSNPRISLALLADGSKPEEAQFFTTQLRRGKDGSESGAEFV